MTHICSPSINPSTRVRGLFENVQRVRGLQRGVETCGCPLGSAQRSAEQRSGTGRQRGAKVWVKPAQRPAEEGGPLRFIHARGVNVGTKTPILLILEAFRGGGGGGRGGPTAAALTYRFSRQGIDGIRGRYSLLCCRLHLFNFLPSVTCLICKIRFYQSLTTE